MPGVLKTVPVSDEERRANDRHRASVVAAVLIVLAVYLYLFSDVSDLLAFPAPVELAQRLGVEIEHVFDDDGNVESNVYISYTDRFSGDRERLILGTALFGAFLSAYFLPLAWKQRALVGWALGAIAVLYGVRGASGLLFAHTVVYLVLHPPGGRLPAPALLAGALAGVAFASPDLSATGALALPAALAPAAAALHTLVLRPLLARPRAGAVLRTLVVQSALLTVCVSALIEGATGFEWSLPLGVLLFFWQWTRVILYHIDWKDGRVPSDVSLGRYLAVFLSPGVIPVWQWGISVGQGYAYVHDNFLCRDKNEIVMSGVWLLLLALLYLVFFDWVRWLLVDLFGALGIPVHRGSTRGLVRHFMRGGEVGTLSVLMTTLLDMARWILLWAGVFHFKVGVWRICGYRFDPSFNRPWAATNLVAFWPRITLHYREFLVRAFYYPVFFRWFRNQPNLRIFVATVAAAGAGNLVWGHVAEHLLYGGMTFDVLVWELQTWPYFLLLGGGIGLTELWLRWRRRRRKAWTLGPRVVIDLLAAWCTIQFFTMIRIFRRPAADSTVWDLFRLFLRGLGI
jgi:hypothetical protein